MIVAWPSLDIVLVLQLETKRKVIKSASKQDIDTHKYKADNRARTTPDGCCYVSITNKVITYDSVAVIFAYITNIINSEIICYSKL